MQYEPYCKIYVDSVMSKQQLCLFIAETTGGTLSLRTIENELLSIDVFDNQDARRDSPPDSFVDWPIYLEVESVDSEMATESYVTALGDLLLALRKAGARAVAACDFEDQLPVAG
jgi:hypothetical protein